MPKRYDTILSNEIVINLFNYFYLQTGKTHQTIYVNRQAKKILENHVTFSIFLYYSNEKNSYFCGL